MTRYRIETLVRCNACGDDWPEDCIVQPDEARTGGDTICYRCHVACVPEDADRLAEGLERCRGA